MCSGSAAGPSFASSGQTQQALPHNVTVPARDKLQHEKQLAEAQARQDGSDASRKKKKKKRVIQAFPHFLINAEALVPLAQGGHQWAETALAP